MSRVLLFFFLFLSIVPSQAQTPAQSTTIAAVPAWFTHCAGQNATCTVYGAARVIYGTASGDLPVTGGSFLTQVVNGSVVCSDDTFGEPALGSDKACWYGPVDGLAAGTVQATGGADYPFYVQNYGLWDGSLRHVVGHYNADPTLVEAQLRQFYKTGQRNVSLVLWYMPFNLSATPVDWLYAQAFMDSTGGSLSPLLQSNLTAVLNLIQQIGFTQVTIRFAPVGAASPVSWGNTWNETAFDNDEAFEFNTRQVVEAALAGTQVKRMYDLGIEMGGIPHDLNADGVTFTDGQSPIWTSRLWVDYVNRYGNTDSYGFSIAYRYGTLGIALSEFDRVGIRPNLYAVDDYIGTDLWSIYQELVGAGDSAKPVVLQEVSYNDSTEAASIQTALPHFPLNIASINQWPVNTTSGSLNAEPPASYGAYGGSTDASGSLVVAPCTLATGHTSCTAQVSWATSNATNVALYVNGVQASTQSYIATTLSNTADVSLGVGATSLLLVSSQGTLNDSTSIASAADLTAGQTILVSQTATALDPTVPVITSAGLGGSNQQSIWALGSSLSSGCSVQLYDGNASASAAVASLTGVNCAPASLSFALPDSFSRAYSALTFTVTNPGSAPSAPYTLPIAPIPTVTSAGVGGANGGAIWAIGRNFTTACSVRLYDPAAPGAGPLVTLPLTCAPLNLSFSVPASIAGSYPAVNLTVVDTGGQESAAVQVTLQ